MPRRSVTTTEALVAAATTLVAEHGVAGMHLGRVARACDVSVGTVYNHFDGKAGLVAAVARGVEADFVSAMDAAAPAGRPLRPAVPALVSGLLEVAGRSPAVRMLREADAADDHGPGGRLIRSWIADRVAAAQATGEVGTADPGLVAELAYALVQAALPHAATPRGARTVEELLIAGLVALLPLPDAQETAADG